jgi:hypothetical protein
MSNLAQLRDRIEITLVDAANAIWSAGALDDALTTALDQYNLVNPQEIETSVTLAAAGREISLTTLTDLIRVREVWWPWISTIENWPPNRVRGFRVYRDSGVPMLFMDILEGAQPQSGEKVRIWYDAPQTIDDLNGSATTVPIEHESYLVIGAAGYAALSRTIDLIEISGTDLYQVGLLGSWGVRRQKEYANFLKILQGSLARGGASWGAGWALDKWDEGRDLPRSTYG